MRSAWQDTITFPSFKKLTWLDGPSMTYFALRKGTFTPKRHWCFMGEITDAECFFRPTALVRTLDGEVTKVMFYHDRDDPGTPGFYPDADHLEPGRTLAVLYAERKTFMDMTDGIRQEDLRSCWVFNAPLSVVSNEGQRLLEDADLHSQGKPSKCFVCQQESLKMSRCGACKLAKYCGKECQKAAWDSHKKLCKDADRLLRLASLPRKASIRSYSPDVWHTMHTLPPYTAPGDAEPSPADDSSGESDEDSEDGYW